MANKAVNSALFPFVYFVILVFMILKSEQEVLESLYSGLPLEKLFLDSALVDLYNQHASKLSLTELSYTPTFTEEWFYSDKYASINIREYFLSLCKTDIERERVNKEIDCVERTQATDFFKYLIYLSDLIREYDIVTGIGRGSSVSLYILFLCGLHKVDALKYELSYTEFFKNEMGK